jgi:hypothetical protein
MKRNRKKSGWRTFLTTIGALAAVGLAAWFLLPGLSRPYDFGVKSSEASYESAVQKLGISGKAPASPEAGAAAEQKGAVAPQAVRVELSSEEVTSLLDKSSMRGKALKNIQVRINPNDTLDTSGTADTDYLFDTVLKGRYTREEAAKAMPMLGVLPDQIHFSCNFDFTVRDNKTQSLHINRLNLMGFPVPESLAGADKAEPFAEQLLDEYLQSLAEVSGTSYDLIRASGGVLELEGKFRK